MSNPKSTKFVIFSAVAILATSALFAAWQNNAAAGLFMFFLLTCIYLGVFRGEA
jgi:hypothetical protein